MTSLHVVGDVKVDGTMYASGDITAFSDSRLKGNIQNIEPALEKVCKLTGYTFDRVDMHSTPARRHVGLLAQDVHTVLPEAVHVDEDGYYSVAYGNMLGLVVNALKELRTEVKELRESQKNVH